MRPSFKLCHNTFLIQTNCGRHTTTQRLNHKLPLVDACGAARSSSGFAKTGMFELHVHTKGDITVNGKLVRGNIVNSYIVQSDIKRVRIDFCERDQNSVLKSIFSL